MKISVAPLLKADVGEKFDFHVHESPIDPHGENRDLLDAGIGSIDADIVATHTDPGALLEGDISASIAQECARCLTEVTSEVRTTFAEQYYAKLHVETGAPMPTAPLDAKVIGSDFRIDLTPLLREEVILAMPLAPLCRPECKGLCPECGVDLNVSPHGHEAPVDDRWTALRALKIDDGGDEDVKD
jgi:DUF177 domain-containing protein